MPDLEKINKTNVDYDSGDPFGEFGKQADPFSYENEFLGLENSTYIKLDDKITVYNGINADVGGIADFNGTSPDIGGIPDNLQARSVVPVDTGRLGTKIVQNSDKQRITFSKLPNVKPNPVHKFSTFNTIFTLEALTTEEVNHPAMLKKLGSRPGTVLARSGGSADGYKSTLDKGSIKREFFIQDVEIETIPGGNTKTKNAQVVSINFKVYEPYSLGGFLQNIREAARTNGHNNWTQAPYALRVNYAGYDEEGKKYIDEQLKGAVITCRIIKCEFNVTQGGSTYDVEAIPFNMQALSNTNQTLTTEVSIEGKTVAEMLQGGVKSLQSVLNKRKKEQKEPVESRLKDSASQEEKDAAAADLEKKKNSIVLDDYIINFPLQEALNRKNDKDLQRGRINAGVVDSDNYRSELLATNTEVRSGVTNAVSYKQDASTLNEFGKYALNLTDSQVEKVAEQVFTNDKGKKLRDAESDKKNLKNGKLVFPQGTSIESIITAVIIYSKAAESTLFSNDSEITWFKIHPQSFIIPNEDIFQKYGRHPLMHVYNIIPFKTMKSMFQKANERPTIDTKMVEKAVNREYDYLYTGKNLDILDFNINYQTAYFQVLPSDNLRSKTAPGNSSKDVDKESEYRVNDLKSNNNTSQGTPASGGGVVMKRTAVNLVDAAASMTSEQRLGLELNDALMHSQADLIEIEMTVLGDPYWVGDGGLGNYIPSVTSQQNVGATKDNTVNFFNRYPIIVINFRTPLDIDEITGETIFKDQNKPANENFVKVQGFSGIYTVFGMKNSWQGGLWKTTIKGTRVLNQEMKKSGTDKDSKLIQKKADDAQAIVDPDTRIVLEANEQR